MNYSGNMPDWQQYHSPQPIGSEVPSAGGQNVNHSPIFGPSISPRRLNGSSFSPEGLTKPQNDANYNSRNFQQSPNTLNGHNVPPENPPIGATVLMSGCHRHYGTPSPRNTMIEGTNASLDSRNVPVSSMNEVAGQRNHQIPMNGPAGHMSCPTISGPMGPMGQRNTPTALQAPIPTNSRQGPGSYMPCKGPCCNPDTSLSYQSWEKFGPYPPNVPYRSDTGYSVDNRRFGNEFGSREPLSTTAYNVDPRRNFPDYKYRKDSIIQRPYAHPPSVIQSYPVQNYNFTGDYQKYPGYPVKEYPRDNSITNSQNPAILKYQEQSVIVQQKYFTKQIQYQNGVIPKSIVPANMGGNIISRGQNPYFNPPLAGDFPRDYSDSNSLVNKGIQTPNAIHPTYSKYQMYQQKIAMQRFSMENHMQELTRIPGYQSHPKYQECILRHKELLRLQQNVDYQSIVQGTPRAVTSQVNDDIPPINLQFDQNGVLINSTFAPAGFSNLQSPINVRNAKNIQSVSNREIGAENVHHPEQFKTQSPIDNHIQSQVSSSLSQCSLPCKNEESYSVQKEFKQDQYNVKKSEREAHNLSNIENDKNSSILQRNSSDFADKPELDVRQFLANWDESEDEDAGNGNLPDAVSSNSTSSVVPEYENTKVVLDNSKEPANSSNVQDCQSTDDCERFEDTQNNRKSSNYTENEIYKYDLQHDGDSSKSSEQDFGTSDSGKSIITDETEIQSTGSDYKGETELHVTEKLLDCQDIHTSTKVQCQEKKSLNNNDSQEISNSMEVDIMVPKKSTQKETITTIKEHIETHKFDSTVDIRSDIEEAIESDNNSRSSYSEESSDNKEDHFSSNGDVSESSNGKSMNSHSISSVIKLPKTIKGTEIHIDAQELAAIPVSPKSNSEVLEGSDLQKQNSFVDEESHNPDDISLPDLPTSECTPISTTLNTPIHSDSEESLDPVIDLTIPTNPIEIIQNSPMLSFTHSPIKMEPYEHFEENDFTGKLSQDAMEFDFHANNSCDNDFEKLTDVSSHTTEQYNVAQSNEETFDSDCIEVLSEKAEQKVVGNMHKLEINEIVADSNVAKNFSVDQSQFSFSKENAVTTNETNSNMGDTDCEAWSLVTVKDREHHISNATNHQDEKNDIDKLQTLSEFGNKLSERLEGTKSNFEESAVQAPTDKNHYGISRWQIRCETDDEVTALNLVKDENKVNSDSKKMTDRVTTLQAVNCEEISFKSSNNRNCDSSVESKQLFTSLEHTDLYSSSSEEDTIYTETTENQHFSSSSTIPLIPGEYSEEPKIPVLPMEGNCLTKIIKNTSPITDLDVLGSDDEKLEKIDELWMEVGGVETVDKVTDVNTDCCTVRCKITDCEKILDLRNKQRKLQSSECKRLKHSVKTKDVSNSFGRIWDNSKEMELKSNTSKNTRLDETCSLNAVQQKIAPVNDKVRTDCSINTGTQNAIEILPEQHTLSKPPIDSKPTSSKLFCENDHLTHNICPESNVTEIMKCQEKANHVNDIATKLLENARLIEPESKKTEILRKDSFCTNNISNTSKKRIKLLKEYRKMKSTVNTDSAGNQSRKTEDDINSNIVSSTDIVEECKAIVVTDVAKVNIEVVKNSKKNTVQEVSKEFNCLRQNINLDTAVSPDIIVPEEKYRKILYHGERAVLNKDRQIDNDYYVNMETNITVENSGTTNSSKTLNTMVVNLFDKDTNECAINLSKSSTDYDLLHTLHEDDCVRSDNHNSCVSEDIARDEIREIKSGGNEEKKFALSGTAYAADNPLYTQMVEKDNDTLDKNNIKACNAVEDNGNSNITSAPARLTEECTLKEHNMHEMDQQSIEITADGSQLEKFSPIPQKIQESIECSKNSEEIINNFFVCENSIAVSESESGGTTEYTSKQNGISALNESVAENEVHNVENVNEIVDREVACDLQNAHRDVVSDSSFVNNEKLMKSVSNFGQSKKSSSFNHAREEETTAQNHQNLLPCRTNLLKAGNTESIENCIDTSPCQEIKNVCTFLSEKVEGMECEPSIVSDSSIIVKKDVTDDIRKESLMMNEDAECKRNSLNLNKPLPEISLESTKSGNSQYSILNDINLPLGTDRSMETISMSLAAFGFENSFHYDFNNFDVAPNIDEVVENDQSNTWKYSKAHSRFEDCERYKNPDNCISPILASLECLDNLNTVPIYTTKDGKITYSPNPKFTYRALIMEAREREGYSDTRDSYCRTSRTPENLGYSKNQTSFRKRKSSNGYRHSGGYTKKHYLDHYEPKEHGESSTNNLTEPWNKSYFSRNKYRHQPRDRKSHHFLHHNLDSQKKHDTQKIAQEISSSKYTLREGCTNLEDHYKQKNGTANSFKWKNRREFEQSTEQPVPVSVLLRNTQDLNRFQNPGEFAQPKQSTSTTSIKKFKNCEKRGSIEENVCDLQHGDQSKDPHKRLTQKLASGSDQHKPVSGCTTNLVSLRLEPSTSSHPQYIENKKMDLKVKELELSFPKLRYKSFNDQYLSEIPNSKLSKDLNDESETNDQYLSEIPNRKLSEDLNDESETNEIDCKENKTNMLYDHVDELKENSENVVQRKNCLVIDIPITKSLFDETQEVDHKKNEANVLYDQVDEWKGSCGRLAVHRESFLKTDVPKETLLDKTNEVHHEENKENMLCDRNDDIYKSRTSNISKNKLIDSIPLESECIIAPESVKSAETIETLEEIDHNLENLNSVKDEAIINISHIEDETCLTPVQVILANKNSDAPKVAEISEIENKSGPKMSSNAGIQNLSEEAKSNQLLNKADVQTSSVFVVHCSSESQDVDQENTFNEDRNIDNRLELKSADSIDDVQGKLVSVKSNDNIFRCPEESDSSQSEQNHVELAKKVSEVESNEITSKNENGMLVKDCAKEQVDSHIIKMKCEYENIAKSQPQFENYVTYSPLSESPEDPKVIPKLVIKKTDSLSCKNICLTSTILLQDLGAEKILGKDVKNSKASPHPKIPKILIRNAKSRPSTPSIEEISDEKLSSPSTKEDNKSHKVKIRSEETRSTSPTAASHANNLHTDIIESKIPKMKIKLEDRSSKVIIENVITEFRASNEDVQKIIPKMKIKKLKGTLRQVVDTKILPVSIPRMCIYTELEDKKQTRTITREDENEPSTLGENLTSVAPNSILSNKKSMNDIEFKRIPKLKIKRQSLGCTVELNRKRYNASPVQSEPKKIKKSLKQTESNDKKLSSKLPLPIPSEYLDSPKKQDSSAIGRCHHLNCSEMDEYASANDSCVKIKNDQVKSTKGKISVGPKEIPKVIIKRTSPSAEFKCELSKGRRDAIILNKMWQPEVKLQRSWVLDCMAKDLNLNNLKLKLATPDSLRKKSLLQKRTEQGQAMHVANDNVNKSCSKYKLFRSKSTSDLVSERGHAETLVDYHNMQQKQTSTANLPIQSSTRKRCKSDVGSIFTKHSENSKCDKKLKYDYDSHRIQLIPKNELNCKDNVENSSNIQSIKECQVVTGNHENIWDPEIKSEKSCAFQNHNEPMNPIKTFKIKPEKTLDENMNSKSEHFVLRRKPLLNDKPLDKAVIDLNLNSKILTNNSTSNFECSKNDNEIVHIIANCFSATGKQEVLEDTTMTKNATVNSLHRHMKIEINTTETRPTIIEDRKMDLTPVEIEILKNKDTSCDEINQVRTVIDDINIRDHPITLPHIMSVNPDVNISKKDSENCFYKNSINAAQIVDSESIDCSNNISKLYNTDNSDEDANQGDNQNHISENLILDIAVEEQRKSSVPNENVLNKPTDFDSISTDSSSEYVQNPEIDTNLNSSLDNADDSDEDSVIKAESFETTQATSEPVSTLPSFSRYEMEIPSYTDTIKDNEMCLYSEDAIPTQYELELELTDTLAHDSSEVPIPETGNYDKEVPYYSQDDTNENSHQFPSILSTLENIGNLNETKSESTTPDNNENNFSKVRSIKHQEEPLAYPDDEDTISCTHIGKLDVNNDGHMESAVGHDRNIEESSCHSDSLVKEVLAAKETLKKCLAKNKDETRFKLKSRPKTAAEKKQGLSFDVSVLPVCNESLTMLSTLPNGSELMDQNFDTTNKNKFLQIQTKTKFEINTNNLDRKHSKGSKHKSMQRKYSNFPPNEPQRNDSITQVKESFISKHSSIDNKGNIELAEDDMTISLKNSKYLMKKKSFSDTHKKIPELMNSKDNKCRSKMLKHDLDAKYVGKSKIGLENITLQESSTDFIQCKEKLNTSKPKHKSLKTLLDQNVKSVKDKTKFKFYKIPKLTKPTHRESQRLTEEVEESQRKEARMPILEPQVDINMDLDIATFNFGREMSRSPPVITIQESLTHYETATSSSRDDSRQVSSNKEKEVLSKQGIMFADPETPEAMLTLGKGTTVADIVNDMAYHEKAIIKHKRYCTLCERWFPTVTRYRRHLSGYQHRHTELTQRRTIHALFTLFTGKPCPRLQPPGVVRIDCGPGELTPLQIAVQGVTKESSKMDNNIEQPTSDDK